LSQYDDHSCEIVVKFDFKSQSYGPETILLKGHTVTLTFKVATQKLGATHQLNMVIISVKYFQNPISNNKVIGRTQFGMQGHAVTLTFKVATQMLHATCHLNMVIISAKYFQNPTSNKKVMGRTRFCCKVML